MIISFFGHSHFIQKKEYQDTVMEFLQEKVGDESCELYFGEYNNESVV